MTTLLNVIPAVKPADYVVCDRIGAGAYAVVYKAFKKSSSSVRGECVAIKAVLRSTLSPGVTESLLTEIRLLKKMKHDHIVQLKDFMCDDNYVYIVMEYCGGGDLSHFIRTRNRLPEAACQRFLQQLAAALQYMRDENISHFDLKPQNILLASRRNPLVKIGDFGLAQHMPESESASKVKGSPLYMAPEILLQKHYDAKVDLWSVGVILYECLFGKAPYSSSTMEELVLLIKSDKKIQLPHNTSISDSCRDLLVRCLERDPAKRITFEEFFEHSFVDLEHKPCAANIDKARSLLNQAVEFDTNREYEKALELYTDSLRYLVPAIYVESDVTKKTALRRSAEQYLDRTEKIKGLLLQNGIAMGNVEIPVLPQASMELNDIRMLQGLSAEHHRTLEELLPLASTTANMTGAIDIGKSAELYEMEGNYTVALEKYELALGKLLSLLGGEPHGRRRDLLLEVLNTWMSRAEKIKSILVTGDKKESSLSDRDAAVISDGSNNVTVPNTEKKQKQEKTPKSNSLVRQLSKHREVLEPSGFTFGNSFATSLNATSKILSESDYEKNCNLQ